MIDSPTVQFSGLPDQYVVVDVLCAYKEKAFLASLVTSYGPCAE